MIEGVQAGGHYYYRQFDSNGVVLFCCRCCRSVEESTFGSTTTVGRNWAITRPSQDDSEWAIAVAHSTVCPSRSSAALRSVRTDSLNASSTSSLPRSTPCKDCDAGALAPSLAAVSVPPPLHLSHDSRTSFPQTRSTLRSALHRKQSSRSYSNQKTDTVLRAPATPPTTSWESVPGLDDLEAPETAPSLSFYLGSENERGMTGNEVPCSQYLFRRVGQEQGPRGERSSFARARCSVPLSLLSALSSS